MELVKSGFTIKSKRMDAMEYDPQACAFIIIEYKKDKNTGAVDQGFTYNFKKISILQKINSKYFQFPTFNIYLQPQ